MQLMCGCPYHDRSGFSLPWQASQQREQGLRDALKWLRHVFPRGERGVDWFSARVHVEA